MWAAPEGAALLFSGPPGLHFGHASDGSVDTTSQFFGIGSARRNAKLAAENRAA